MNAIFLQRNRRKYASYVERKTSALDYWIGFIDGTVILIAHTDDFSTQKVAYNGHKRKYALKFQAVTDPDVLVLHVAGPIERRKHDCTLYLRSGMDEVLEGLLNVEGKQNWIYGDAGRVNYWILFTKALIYLRRNMRWKEPIRVPERL